RYGCMSLIARGTSSPSVQPFTAYGPVGAPAVFCDLQPSGLATNARNFLAASSLSPVVVFGMYRPPGVHRVRPFLLASSPGNANSPTVFAASGYVATMFATTPD